MGHWVCLRVNSHSFLLWAQPHKKPIMLWMHARCERALITPKIVRSRDVQRKTEEKPWALKDHLNGFDFKRLNLP